MKLDSSQLEFVNSEAENIRLLAPAGSGKTTTLLYRCKRLLEWTPGERVLLFTFTRVACEELKQRLRSISDFAGVKDSISVFTLNAYGNRLLKRKYAGFRQLGVDKKARHFVLANYLRPVVDKSPVIAANINNKSWVNKHANVILDMLDQLKSLGFDHQKMGVPEEFLNYCIYLVKNDIGAMLQSVIDRLAEVGLCVADGGFQDQIVSLYKNFIHFYSAATEMLALQNQFTLEDQKYWGWKLTQESPKISGAARYAHIMVDEFQDINPVDLFFISALRERHQATLTLVGDDDQTIFEWRGATPKYILDPGQYIFDCGEKIEFKTYILSKNYRSPSNIVDMSQRLIAHNKERVKKQVVPVNTDYAKIDIVTTDSYDEVTAMVENDLKDPKMNRVAIISRKKSHLIPYQIILSGHGVNFYAAEDLNVMLNDAFNMLKGLIDIKRRQAEGNSQSFMTLAEDMLRLCNALFRYPLKKADAETLKGYMYHGQYEDINGAIDHFSKMGEGMIKSIDPANYVGRLRRFAAAATVQETINCISEDFTGLKKDFRKADDDIFYADPPFPELAEFSSRYKGDFDRFCLDVERTIASLSAVVSADDKDMSDEERRKIFTHLYLMTGLRAKGKEFDSVYILHADWDVWPIKKAVELGRVEPERRLFYVAVTRARKKMVFVTNGYSNPSPYLAEMGLINPDAQFGPLFS